MRRILVVSCYFASDFEGMVWGPFIRLRLLVEAASRAANTVDLLLFASADKVASAVPTKIAASIVRAWGIEVNVLLAARVTRVPDRITRARRWIGSLRTVRDHPDYGRAAGPRQSAAVASALRDDTDLVVAYKLEAALPIAACDLRGIPSIIDIDDVEHVSSKRRLEQLPSSVGKWVAALRLPVIRRGELATLGAFDVGLVCSATDRDYLAALQSKTRIEVNPNAMDFDDARSGPRGDACTIVFLASYAYQPNVDAAEELIHRVFPLVLAEHPDARLLIAGAFAEKLPSFGKQQPHVRVAGFVADVAEVYAGAALLCCPIRAGGGTRIKIIEASSWKLPTVSTPLGAEGLDLRDGVEILLADDAVQLARCCSTLLAQPSLGATIGRAAYARAKAAYDRTAAIDRLAGIYRSAAAAARPARSATRV